MHATSGKSKSGRPLDGILIFIFLFFISNWQQISVFALIALFAFWVLSGKIKSTFNYIRQNPILVLPVLFYLAHVVSLLYSENMQYAFADLQTKMSFLVMPLMLPAFLKSPNRFSIYWNALYAGLVLALGVSLMNAVNEFFISNEKGAFFYSRFSYFMHPGYFTMYLNVAVLLLLSELFSNDDGKISVIKIVLMLFFLSGIVLCNARMPMMVSVMTILIYTFHLIRKRNYKKSYIRLGLAILFAILLTQALGLRLYNRFTEFEEMLKHERPVVDIPGPSEYQTGTSIRIHLWNYALEVIKRNPIIGVGVGDIKEELLAEYKTQNFEYGVKTRISPHNQYIHTGVLLGMMGLLILLIMFLVPVISSIKGRNILLILFLFMILFNSLTESILERQAGVLFFVFFYVCLHYAPQARQR